MVDPPRDPTGPADFVILVLAIFSVSIFATCNCYIYYKRENWLPFRCLNLQIFLLSSLGGVIWILSSLVTNGHFYRPAGTIWSQCWLFTFFLVLLFGYSLWLNTLCVRMFQLYTILIKKKKPASAISLIALFQSPTAIFTIIASFAQASQYTDGDCKIVGIGWRALNAIIYVYPYVLFIVFSALLRKIQGEFIQFRALVVSGAVALVLFIIGLILIGAGISSEEGGRFFLTLFVMITVHVYYWTTIAKPVYKCFLQDQVYLQKFERIFRTANPYLFEASLEDLLHDPVWRDKFKQYAAEKLSRENIDFWEACMMREEIAQQRSVAELQNFTRSMINTFIKQNGSKQVNLASSIREEILSEQDMCSLTIFHRAKEDVLLLMELNLFRPFVAERSYKEWKASEVDRGTIGELLDPKSASRNTTTRRSGKEMAIGVKQSTSDDALNQESLRLDGGGTGVISMPTEFNRPLLAVSAGFSINLSDRGLSRISSVDLNNDTAKLWFNGNLMEELHVSTEIATGYLSGLVAFYGHANRITRIHDSFMSIRSLTVLALCHNHIDALPPSIGNLTNLQELSLSHNRLRSLPLELFKLVSLSLLNVDYNQISELPENFGEIRSLCDFSAKHNQLTSMSRVTTLTHLRRLDLSHNKISAIPADIGALTQLKQLYLQNNAISSLPESTLQLSSLRVFRLVDNPISLPPFRSAQTFIRTIIHGDTDISSPKADSSAGPDLPRVSGS